MERGIEGLSLTGDGDDLTLNIEKNQNGSNGDMQRCLVGRFLTNNPIRNHIMKDRLSTIWMPGKGATIK